MDFILELYTKLDANDKERFIAYLQGLLSQEKYRLKEPAAYENKSGVLYICRKGKSNERS